MRQENLLDLSKEEIIKRVEKKYNSDILSIIDTVGRDEFLKSCENNYYNKLGISFVYFLKNNLTGLTKIGCTKDISSRMSSIKSTFKTMIGIEPDLKLEYLILCNKGEESKVERQIHKIFNDYRTFGEWFENLDECDYYENVINPELFLENGIGIGVYNDLIKDEYSEELSLLNINDLLSVEYLSKQTIKDIMDLCEYKQNIFDKSKVENKNKIDTINKIINNVKSKDSFDDIIIRRCSLLAKINTEKLNSITINL